MRELTNERWGFSSSCFVCERTNHAGLKIPFHHDEERQVVVATFELGGEFSGAPTYLHGGVVLAILDEAMAWATIAVGGTFAVTRTTQTTFEHPVRVGRPYRVEARLEESTGDVLSASAVILDGKDRPCATASADFVALGPAQASEAAGSELRGDDATFVRGR
jgi:acyl-coenzyme A thioesterase PaaI-like protein